MHNDIKKNKTNRERAENKRPAGPAPSFFGPSDNLETCELNVDRQGCHFIKNRPEVFFLDALPENPNVLHLRWILCQRTAGCVIWRSEPRRNQPPSHGLLGALCSSTFCIEWRYLSKSHTHKLRSRKAIIEFCSFTFSLRLGLATQASLKMPRLSLGVAILSAVLVCVQDGSASSFGQNNLLDADQQNMTTPTTSPVTASPLCPGEQDLLHVEASDEARKALVGWLAKDTARLTFIYFDLVVGNLTYHPGSCPDDGTSAIDAQTPLAWVLTNGGPDGGSGALGTHSFAHAYLTLPVSYPRIYSLGILEGYYVATLRHNMYRMKVVVDTSTSVDAESCWKSLNKTEKSSLMFDVVESFVSNLIEGVTLQNTTSWNMCYSDPTSDDLPLASSALMPYTPAYICRDEKGSLRQLDRDSFLNGLFVVFVGLSIATIALQFYALSMLVQFATTWGEKMSSPFEIKNDKTFNEGGLFDKTRLPVHVTVGGVLCSDIVFGQTAFHRIKTFLVSAGILVVYAVWPFYLTTSIFVPTADINRFAASWPESFGNYPCSNKLYGQPVTIFSTVAYILFSIVFAMVSIFPTLFIPKPKEDMSDILTTMARTILLPVSSIFLTLLTYPRIIFQFPWSPHHLLKKYPVDLFILLQRLGFALIGTFFMAQLIFWIPVLLVTASFLVLCLIGVFGWMSTMPLLNKRMREVDDSMRNTSCGLICLLITFTIIILWMLLFLYIQGSELLLFALLSAVSLYIMYPLQSFLIVTWALALVVETQDFVNQYKAPLLLVQEKFTEKVEQIAKDYITIEGGEDGSVESVRLCLANTLDGRPNVNWKKFFRESESVWCKACLRLLTGIKKSESVQNKLWDEVHYVRHVMKWLDVRQDPKIATLDRLQKILWMRLFNGLSKLFILLCLFFSVMLLLLAFNSLWKDLKDTNLLLLPILIVPLYTFLRSKMSSSSLSDDDKLLVEKMLDADLGKCFNDSIVNVSKSTITSSR